MVQSYPQNNTFTPILGSETTICDYIMDYDKFKKELEQYDDWDRISMNPRSTYFPSMNDDKTFAAEPVPFHLGGEDIISFSEYGTSDRVNSPAHYTRGTQEAIDIIEEAIQDAPDVKSGMLQAQALKYLLRLWLKDDPKQDAEKARWYLNRLIDSLS